MFTNYCLSSICFSNNTFSGGTGEREYLEIVFKPSQGRFSDYQAKITGISSPSTMTRLCGNTEVADIPGASLNLRPGDGRASYLLLTWIRSGENVYSMSYLCSTATFRLAQTFLSGKKVLTVTERQLIETELKRQAVATFVAENEDILTEHLENGEATDVINNLQRVSRITIS